MGCCRITFGLTLAIRAAFHLLIAGYAAMDLKEMYEQTSGTLKQLALKITHADVVLLEVQFPLGFYLFCGVALFVLACVYPWKGSSRSNITVYAIMHVLYVAAVVYVLYVRTIIDLSPLRGEYRAINAPGLFPASLVLDVLTFVAAVASPGKSEGSGYSGIFPLHRVMVLSPSSVRGVPSGVSTLPPYTQFKNEAPLRQQNAA